MLRPVPAATLAASLLAASLLAGCSDDGGGAKEPPRGWSIVYRVDDRTGPTPHVTTLVVDVVGPYDARSVTYGGEPATGTHARASLADTSLGGAAWTRGHQYLVDRSGSLREVAAVAPGFAGPDTHLDIALATAERQGLVRRAGTATVAGRPCTEWLSQEPLDAGPFVLPTASERTTTCVDAAGRSLRDVWVVAGKVIRTRTAVSVGETVGPVPGGGAPSPAPTDQLPVLTKDVDAARLATALGIAVPSAPPGLRADGVTALLERDLAGGTGRPLREGGAFTWRSGDRLVQLQVQRGLANPEQPPTDGKPVLLASGQRARLAPVLNGLQVRFLTAARLGVTVVGDLPEKDLLAWLGTLRFTAVAGP